VHKTAKSSIACFTTSTFLLPIITIATNKRRTGSKFSQ
jgi:hypothetical protein